jgi:hypothetical protein
MLSAPRHSQYPGPEIVPPPTFIGAGLDARQAIIRARGERASRGSVINETRRSSCENARS